MGVGGRHLAEGRGEAPERTHARTHARPLDLVQEEGTKNSTALRVPGRMGRAGGSGLGAPGPPDQGQLWCLPHLEA